MVFNVVIWERVSFEQFALDKVKLKATLRLTKRTISYYV